MILSLLRPIGSNFKVGLGPKFLHCEYKCFWEIFLEFWFSWREHISLILYDFILLQINKVQEISWSLIFMVNHKWNGKWWKKWGKSWKVSGKKKKSWGRSLHTRTHHHEWKWIFFFKIIGRKWKVRKKKNKIIEKEWKVKKKNIKRKEWKVKEKKKQNRKEGLWSEYKIKLP